MPLVQNALALSDATDNVDTIRIQANTSKLQAVFYGTDATGNPVPQTLSADKMSFSFKVLNGLNRLQVTIDLMGYPSDSITVEEVLASGNKQLDQFIASPASFIWSPIVQGN